MSKLINFLRQIFENNQKKIVREVPSFLELVNCNEEFAFIYGGKKYELVYCDNKGNAILSLYLSDAYPGTFIQSFKDKEDLLLNGKIEGKNISEILNDIIIC